MVTDHGGAARAVVQVETVLDHVRFAGLDVDARCAVASGTPRDLGRRLDIVQVSAGRVGRTRRTARCDGVVACSVEDVLLLVRLRLRPDEWVSAGRHAKCRWAVVAIMCSSDSSRPTDIVVVRVVATRMIVVKGRSKL